MTDCILALHGADLGYGAHPILHGVSLSLGRGDYLGIVGPNGAGKSTLLKSGYSQHGSRHRWSRRRLSRCAAVRIRLPMTVTVASA